MPTLHAVPSPAVPVRRGIVRLATPDDDEAIHRLNYRTFVEEIPQHAPNAEHRLVDRFHRDNGYAVYEVGGRVVGMVAGRSVRPFSLDTKLGGVDQYLPAGCTPVEIRLLAVEPAFRSTRAFTVLVGFLTRHFLARGFDTAVISGTTRQLRLYQHLGFRAFGPLVGSEGAWYQPMFITTAEVARWPDAMGAVRAVNCLPGPVDMRPAVHAAFRAPPVSHRADAFHAAYRETATGLTALTGARAATLLLGSGTLANDVVAAALVPLGRRGVVATNGEFGDRLVDQARRAGLEPETVGTGWGDPLDYDAIERRLEGGRHAWLWVTHCETSTGVLNDLSRLRAIADARGVRLAIDAISSIGTLPLDLRGVHLASAVSGKALGAYPGIAIILHDGAPVARSDVPRYLDLAYAHAQGGVPFTHSSNLLGALHAALSRDDWSARFAHIARTSSELRGALAAWGYPALVGCTVASPAVLTIPVGDVCSRAVGDALRRDGVLVSYESRYLLDRNWLQLCLMGEWDDDAMADVPRALAGAIARCRASRRVRSAHVRDADLTAPALGALAMRSTELA